MRTFAEIAKEIHAEWKNINPYAMEYLRPLMTIHSSDKNAPYFLDNAGTIALYFLEEARCFRGEKARSLKAELKSLLK